MSKKSNGSPSLLSAGDVKFRINNTEKGKNTALLFAFALMLLGICCYAEFALFLDFSFAALLALASECVIFHIIYTKIKAGFLKFAAATGAAVAAVLVIAALAPKGQWSVIINRAAMFINTAIRTERYPEYATLSYITAPYALSLIGIAAGYIISLVVYLAKNAYIYTLFAIGATLLTLNARPYFCPVLGMICVFTGALVMLFACGTSGEFSAHRKRRDAQKNRKTAVLAGTYVRNAVCALCMVLSCAFIITAVVPQKRYAPIEGFCKDLVGTVRVFFIGEEPYSENGEITDWTSFNEKIIMNKTVSYDELRYDNIDVLRLTVPREFVSPIYLRAFTGAVYEQGHGSNGAWREFTDEEYSDFNSMFAVRDYASIISRPYDYAINSIKGDSVDIQFYTGKLSIEKEWEEDENSYQPYNIFARSSLPSFSLSYDNAISWRSADSCEFYAADGASYEWLRNYYSLNGKLPELDDAGFSYVDRIYTSRVLTKYLETPSWLERSEVYDLLSLPADLRIPDGRAYTEYSDTEILGLVDSVDSYLKERFSYTTAPKASKSGVDTVCDFIFNSKEGYCMHFASAATLLLRSLGIPARYVSGFYIDPSQHITMESTRNNTITVTDRMAHAWTEVYFPGMGWMPIDVTKHGESEGGGAVSHTGSTDRPEETATQAPEITETPSTAPQVSRRPERSDLFPENTMGASDTTAPDLNASAPSGESPESADLSLLWASLAALALIVAAAAFGYITRGRRAKRYSHGENAVPSIYEGLLTLVRLKRVYIAPTDIQTDIAKKLEGSDLKAFTNDIIRAYELAAARSFGHKMTSAADLEFMLSLYKAVEKYVFENSGALTKAYILYLLHIK